MKILAKERLLARQLPPELDQLAYKSGRKSITDYMKWLGIDLNSTPYEEVSNKDAKKIIKQTNRLGCLLCFFRKYARDDYEYALLTAYKDADTNRTKILLDRSSLGRNPGSISSIIDSAKKIYFFKGNEQTRKRLEDLRQERRENRIPESQRRIGRDNTPRPYFNSEDDYDKSGYEKRNLQVDLAEKRLDKATEKVVKCIQGICKINKEEAAKYLDLLTVKTDRWWWFESNMNRLSNTLSSIDKYLKATCKALGFTGYISMFSLTELSRDTAGREDIINFVYNLDVSAFLRVYRKLISDELSKI